MKLTTATILLLSSLALAIPFPDPQLTGTTVPISWHDVETEAVAAQDSNAKRSLEEVSSSNFARQEHKPGVASSDFASGPGGHTNFGPEHPFDIIPGIRHNNHKGPAHSAPKAIVHPHQARTEQSVEQLYYTKPAEEHDSKFGQSADEHEKQDAPEYAHDIDLDIKASATPGDDHPPNLINMRRDVEAETVVRMTGGQRLNEAPTPRTAEVNARAVPTSAASLSSDIPPSSSDGKGPINSAGDTNQIRGEHDSDLESSADPQDQPHGHLVDRDAEAGRKNSNGQLHRHNHGAKTPSVPKQGPRKGEKRDGDRHMAFERVPGFQGGKDNGVRGGRPTYIAPVFAI